MQKQRWAPVGAGSKYENEQSRREARPLGGTVSLGRGGGGRPQKKLSDACETPDGGRSRRVDQGEKRWECPGRAVLLSLRKLDLDESFLGGENRGAHPEVWEPAQWDQRTLRGRVGGAKWPWGAGRAARVWGAWRVSRAGVEDFGEPVESLVQRSGMV